MKKKLMLAIAIIAVVAISVTVLAGCGVKTVEQFAEKLEKAQSFTMTSGEDILQFDGKTMYMKQTFEGTTQEVYSVIEGDKSIAYVKVGDKWGKMESPISADDKAKYTVKKMLEQYTSLKFDEKLYDIKDGVWTLKADPTVSLKIEKGNLVFTANKTARTVSLKKITVKLPKEAEKAEKIEM